MKQKKFWFLIGSIVVIVAGAIAAVCVGVISIPMDAVFGIVKARICGQEVPVEWQTFEFADSESFAELAGGRRTVVVRGCIPNHFPQSHL